MKRLIVILQINLIKVLSFSKLSTFFDVFFVLFAYIRLEEESLCLIIEKLLLKL